MMKFEVPDWSSAPVRYKCIDCGEVFDKPAVIEETLEYWGAPAIMKTSVCPVCKVGDYTRLHPCRTCEDGWTEDEYCEDCLTLAKTMVLQMYERLGNELAISYAEAVDLATEAFEEMEG